MKQHKRSFVVLGAVSLLMAWVALVAWQCFTNGYAAQATQAANKEVRPLIDLCFFIAAKIAQSCPANAIQMGRATWVIHTAIKKYALWLFVSDVPLFRSAQFYKYCRHI